MLMPIVKTLVILLIVALIAQQFYMYYNIVIAGSYMSVAPIHLQIITGAFWPLAVLLIGFLAIRAIVNFKISDLN